MQVITQEVAPCTLLLEIEVEPERVNRAFERAVRQLSRNLHIPGFRPGQAPRPIVEQLVSEAEIKRRAADILITDALTQALLDAQMQPYAPPKLELEQIEEDEPFRFKATVPLPPKVELGAYKGIRLHRVKQEVYDREVESALADLQNQLTTYTPVSERGAQNEDRALIELRSLEEAQKPATRYLVVVGRSFGELDQALAQMKPSESKTVALSFPHDFQDPDWAGQRRTVELRLVELYEPVRPPLEDSFAQQLGSENLQALKANIREAILKEKERLEDRRLQGELLDQIRSQSSISIPQTLVQEKAEEELEQFKRELEKQGKTLAAYTLQTGQSEEALLEQIKQNVLSRLQNTFLLLEIAKKEQIRVQEEEIDTEINELAHQGGYDPAQIQRLRQDREVRSRIETDLLLRKVADFLLASAEVEE